MINKMLDSLSEQDKTLFLSLCEKRSYRKKDEVVSQGSSGREMYFVLSGHLRVSSLSLEGKEVSFGVLGEGDYFGELSLLDGKPRSATVTAIRESELLVLSIAQYQRLLSDHPSVANRFLSGLLLATAHRLRETDELYQDAVFLDVPARLAKFLLSMSEQSAASDEAVLEIKLSQYELGTLINASRESVNKKLKDWQAKGKISIDRGIIRLLDVDYLSDVADCIEEQV